MSHLNTHPHSRAAVEVAGVTVDSFTEASFAQTVIEWTRRPGVDVAVGVNAHVCNLARKDPELRRFLAERTTYADGQSVVWGARLLGGFLPERLATTDVAEPVMRAAAAAGVPVYFLGAAEGVAEAAAEKLRQRIPDLWLRTHHGYFSEADVPAIVRDIADHGTGILFVGLGDPVQERWVRDHAEHLPPAVLTCGGLFDWLSGANPRAPQWMITAGLEWCRRLMLEPRRLAKRYLVGNAQFVAALARQRVLVRG